VAGHEKQAKLQQEEAEEETLVGVIEEVLPQTASEVGLSCLRSAALVHMTRFYLLGLTEGEGVSHSKVAGHLASFRLWPFCQGE